MKPQLEEVNIENILKYFQERENKDYISQLVDNEEIAKQDYTLSVSSYVEKEDTREKVDITELNKEIKRIVAHEAELRDSIDSIVAEIGGDF